MSVPIKQLAALIASNEERFSGSEYVRGESANFLVFEEHPEELKEIIDRLILCQPGRLFVLRHTGLTLARPVNAQVRAPSNIQLNTHLNTQLNTHSNTHLNTHLDTPVNSHLNPHLDAHLDAQLNTSATEITADLKIAQHKISSEVSLWNEEILISSSKESWGRIPSVLRSFIISSAPLFAILPGGQHLAIFAKLGVKVDWAMLDSGKDPQLLRELQTLKPVVSKGVIDLQWLALAQLRELIRREFDNQDLRQHLGLIRRVELDSATRIDSSSPLLMAGWIAHCLGAEPVSLGPWGIECRRGNEPTLNISFSPTILGELQTINRYRVKEEFESAAAQSQRSVDSALDLRIRFEDANGASIASFQHTIEQSSSSKADLVERYFVLGESVANYASSARRALEILRLQQAYEVNEIVGEDW